MKAGFWIRAVASWIDGILVMAGGWALFFLFYGLYLLLISGSEFHWDALFGIKEMASFRAQIIEAAFEFVIFFVYYSYFHFKTGQTLGKKCVGIKVVRLDGQALSLKQSIGRTAGYLLSYLTLGAGYLMAAIHPDKFALHDLICKTHVIYKKEPYVST
jgi:uncharacterized RDD family membrane protein YckC